MTELTTDEPPKGPKRRKSATAGDPVLVAGPVLAVHLDLTPQRIAQLAEDRIIERRPDGRYDQDDSRLRYLRWLRDPARRQVRTEAAAAFVAAKTEMLNLKLAAKRRELVRQSDVDELLEQIAGVTLTHLSGMAARIAGPDLQLRRRIDQVVHETRVAIAQAASKMADERGEPPLEKQ
jgi:hypothetical protein